MTSAQPGTNISEVEVTNVSKHGFWLLIHDQEVFVPFEKSFRGSKRLRLGSY